MTLQEIFDKGATHLITQNEKSVDDNEKCMYRHNGLQCAAGPFIPDDKYDKGMERLGFAYVNTKYNLGYSKDEADFITRLQSIHDKSIVEYWPKHLKLLAEIYGLSTDVLTKVRQP